MSSPGRLSLSGEVGKLVTGPDFLLGYCPLVAQLRVLYRSGSAVVHRAGIKPAHQPAATYQGCFLSYGFRRPEPPTDGRTAGAALLTVCEVAGVLTGAGVAAGVTDGLGLTDVGVALGVGEGVGVTLGVTTGVGEGLQCLLWILGLSVTSSLQGLKSFSLSL